MIAWGPRGDRMKRCRRLGDPLARPAAELFAHRLDHLPLPGDHLQRLGDVLAKLDQLAPAARTDRGRRDDDALARQVRRQRCPHRPTAAVTRGGAVVPARLCHGGGGRFGGTGILGGGRLQLLQLQFQLVEQTATVLRRRPEALALQPGDHQLQMRHHRLGARRPRLRLEPGRPLGQQRRLQRFEIVGQDVGRRGHAADGITKPAARLAKKPIPRRAAAVSPPGPAGSCGAGSSSQCLQADSRVVPG